MARFKLRRDPLGYYLEDCFTTQRGLRVDFGSAEFRYRLRKAAGKNESIARAVKPEAGLSVLDCTGGLGRDAFLLAHLGCRVTVCERSRVMHILLADGLARAREDVTLKAAACNLKLLYTDARFLLSDQGRRYDVIYLDPMFPRRAGSALVGGEMQCLQHFLGTDGDAEDLLRLCLDSGAGKIVLKRPAHSDWRPPSPPNHLVGSRNSRLEIYL